VVRGGWLLVAGDALAAAPAPPPRLDLYGDPLPAGAIARIGSLRWRAGSVRRAHFTSDGKTLVAITSHRSVSFFEVSTGKLLRSRPGVACSPDGRTVATWDEKDSTVILLKDVETGKERCRVEGDWKTGVDPVVFSPDGTIV